MPEPTDDLTSWLREQLDDEERLAHAVLGADASSWDPYGYLPGEKRDYLTRFDPARVLAEVDAKGRILDLHRPYPTPQHMASGDITVCSTCGSVDDSPVAWPCPTVRLLALPRADHPGYREEWRV